VRMKDVPQRTVVRSNKNIAVILSLDDDIGCIRSTILLLFSL